MQHLSNNKQIMQTFALHTGLIGDENKPKRYLWTDAFAVCNFLGLYQESKDNLYKELALKLIDQVHQVLGKFDKDDPRDGWISGLTEKEALKHPTIGGLRIGKPLLEREKHEPYNDEKEWDRDGQYFHYLTKWMHALSRATQVIGDEKYNQWAIELAKTAYKKFTYYDKRFMRQSMYWKMSIDLSRPLVTSMGQHDALDAWITFLELRYISQQDTLKYEINEAKKIAKSLDMRSLDPLGIGGLLSSSFFLMQILGTEDNIFLKQMLQNANDGMSAYLNSENRLNYPAKYRLAFRELGLVIGVEAIPKMCTIKPESSQIKDLEKYLPLGQKILDFWRDTKNQQNSVFEEHVDINSVMLATALNPDGYLHIGK